MLSIAMFPDWETLDAIVVSCSVGLIITWTESCGEQKRVNVNAASKYNLFTEKNIVIEKVGKFEFFHSSW